MKIKRMNEHYNIILVFAILFLSASFLVTNDIISSSLTIGLWIAVFVLILFRKGARINLMVTAITLILLLLMLLTTLLRKENMTKYFKVLFSFTVVALFVSRTSFSSFSSAYVKIMKFLCVVSLVGYGLNIVAPSVFDQFLVRNANGHTFSNYIIYVQWARGGDNASRNWGFAWEPGAYATFVCLAMFLDLFIVTRKARLRTIALYVATTITTFSTTGIVMILGLSLFVVGMNKSISRSTRNALLVVLTIAIAVLMGMTDVLFDTDTNSTFGKIIRFLREEDGEKTGSSAVRYYSVTKGLEAFIKSPFYGWGYEGLIEQTKEFTRGMNTCTFVNWFAVYGALFGSTMLYGVWRLTRFFANNLVPRMLIVLFIFGITMTENYVHTPIILLMVLYGYVLPFHQKEASKEIHESFTDKLV